MALWEKLERYKKLLLNQYFFQSSEFYEAKVSDQIFWSFATKNVKERFFKRNYSHIFVKNYLWEKGWQNPNHSKGWWPSSSWPAIDYNWIQGIQEQPKRTLLPCADGMGSSIRRCFKKNVARFEELMTTNQIETDWQSQRNEEVFCSFQ